MTVRVYGLERAGTNYTTRILDENLDAAVTDRGKHWKHTTPLLDEAPAPDEPHVYVVKHPYAWLDSRLRLRRDRYPDEEVPPATGWDWAKEYHATNATYASCAQAMGAHLVRVEDLAFHLEHTLRLIDDKLPVTVTGSSQVTERVHRGGHTDGSFDAETELVTRWQDTLPDGILARGATYLQRHAKQLLEHLEYPSRPTQFRP